MTKKNDSISWDKQIEKIIKYSNDQGYKVIIKNIQDGISYISFDIKEIVVHSKLNKERQLYTILHELGHHTINKEYKKEYKKYIDYSYKKFSNKSMVFKIAVIDEEIEAWRLGYKLSKKLKIKINRDNFEVYKSSLIKTYILHSIKPKISINTTEKESITSGKRKI